MINRVKGVTASLTFTPTQAGTYPVDALYTFRPDQLCPGARTEKIDDSGTSTAAAQVAQVVVQP